jgi:hypothetical protein
MVFIYALKLEKGKYYIGKTNNPRFRLENHFYSNGSAWTKKYKPTKVLELIPNCDDYDEDKYTRIYMDKYGIDNVRGGSFVSLELDESTKDELKKMKNGTNDKCFKCGNAGHFARDCQEEEEEEEYDVVWCCSYCDKEFIEKNKCVYHEKFCNKKCFQEEEDDDDDDDECVYEGSCCFRCGRSGHYSPSCYASRDIDGRRL